MNRQLRIYLLVSTLAILVVGCRQSKYVHEGNYLLKSNEIEFVVEKKDKIKLDGDHPQLDEGEMLGLIKPVPNRSVALFFYNRIDTLKHQKQIERKQEKYRKKNEKRKIKETKINNRRIDKARIKGDSLYRHKVIREKSVKLGWREWIVDHMGEPPSLLDTSRVKKSREQLEIYLRKKGFYSGSVTDTIIYNEKKRKAQVKFTVNSGAPYIIRNIEFDTAYKHRRLVHQYEEMKKEMGTLLEPGNLLDQDVLDDERDRFSKFCRDQGAFYDFNKNYIGFVADTTVGNLMADITIYVKPKLIEYPEGSEELVETEHQVFKVRHVTFKLHNSDIYSFRNYEAYTKRCDSLGFYAPYRDENNNYYLLDTLEIEGKGTFIYNEIPFVNPDLLDRQNFLEIDMLAKGGEQRYYKEYYVERSYRTLSGLGVFSNITPTVEVDPEEPLGRWVIVTYDLMPLDKTSFLLEPRITNTNGILGISGGASYTNRNLRRGAQELKISFTGGMESQPLIVGTDDAGNVRRAWQLNTFELGPHFALTFPKLIFPFPIPKSAHENFSKRLYPKTVFDLNINYQRRTEFDRRLTEFGYKWKFQQDKVQRWEVSLIKIDFVKLNKEAFFQEKLEQLNDPFLLNSYTDHLTTIFNPVYYYSNLNSNERDNNNLHNIIASLDISGWMLTPLIYDGLAALNFSPISTNDLGQKQIFGVPYTQFIKFDIQYIASWEINKQHKMVFRTMAGMGFASRNSPSLPYEQAFFAGGSNDIRAFQARTMAPGSTKTYADTNSTLTQIGDMRFEANAEWRFEMNSLLEGAVFLDAGNIWNRAKNSDDPENDPAVLKSDSYKEIALGTGFGIRADFEFLIVRLDLAWALHNPHLPEGERWWLTDKTAYRSYFEENPDGTLIDYEFPHALRFNFGIGYPF